MTDPTTPPPFPPNGGAPVPPSAPVPPAAPTPPAPSYAAPGVGGVAAPAKKTLSLTSFILGIAAFVTGLVPFLAGLLGIGAVVLGFLAKSREPGAPKWMWIVGIIAGFIGIAVGLFIFVLSFALLASNPDLVDSY